MYGLKGEVPEGEYTIPIGKTDLKREGKDVTVVAYAKMLGVAMAAAETLSKDGIEIEILDPMTVRPLDDGRSSKASRRLTAASWSPKRGLRERRKRDRV